MINKSNLFLLAFANLPVTLGMFHHNFDLNEQAPVPFEKLQDVGFKTAIRKLEDHDQDITPVAKLNAVMHHAISNKFFNEGDSQANSLPKPDSPELYHWFGGTNFIVKNVNMIFSKFNF